MTQVSQLSSPLGDPFAVMCGFTSWNTNFTNLAGGALTNQAVESMAIWLPFGIPISNICLPVTTAGAGASPTGFFVGLASETTMIVQSGNIIGGAAEAQLKQVLNTAVIPLGSTYTPNKTDSPFGFYRVVFLTNGLYATPLQIGRTQPATGATSGLVGRTPFVGTFATAATALPVNGAAITVTPTNRNWGCAVT